MIAAISVGAAVAALAQFGGVAQRDAARAPREAMPAAGWSSSADPCGGIERERGAGGRDRAGRLYVPCSLRDGREQPYVQVYDQRGEPLRRIELTGFPTANSSIAPGPARDLASDVVPTADARYLYVVRFDTKRLHRFYRIDATHYGFDYGWKLQPVAVAGWTPRGEYIDVDDAGDIYFGSGLWANAPVAIVKYHADGSFVTRFGARRAGSWKLGEFHGAAGGIAVTGDGSRVFVTDINNSRVQRFDRQPGSEQYVATLAFGNDEASDAQRGGICADVRRMAAPYDVALSPAGRVVVVSTSCGNLARHVQLARYEQDGTPIDLDIRPALSGQLVHGLAIDASGGVHLAEGAMRVTAPGETLAATAGGDPDPGPAPRPQLPAPTTPTAPTTPVDQQAPRIVAARLAWYATQRRVTARIVARDDTGVTHVRFADERGVWQPWRAHRSVTNDALLAPGVGFHVVYMQVRDAAGNRSRIFMQPVLLRAARGVFAQASWTWGTSRADRHEFGAGSQLVNYSAFDHQRDVVRCGAGIDVVLAQPEDVVARDCEIVRRVRLPRF